MIKKLIVLMAVVSITNSVTSNEPTYECTWESLIQFKCPEWFRDAKFGIYAHWGPYCVPAFPTTTDWYSHYMYQPNHPIHKFHVEIYGPVTAFGYKELVPLFTAPKFDAEAWAELYAESGARFAGPVAEHCDGFAFWDSKLTEWDSVDKGPRRDVVAEMEKAIRKRGLKYLTSFHHHWKWGWYATPISGADCLDPRYQQLYGPPLSAAAWRRDDPSPAPDAAFSEEWLNKVNEVVDNYHPDLIWFDNRMSILDESYRIAMAAHYYNQAAARNQNVVITFKNEDLASGAGVIDLERSRMPDIFPEPWLTDTSIAKNSWSYCPKLDYYSSTRIIHDLVDIVSKNGSMLLNIAPHPDGHIPAEQQQILRDIGAWLKQNGAAIYGARPWKVFGEGPTKTPEGHLSDLGFGGFAAEDIRFTQSKDGRTLYTILFGWPQDGEILIRSLHAKHGKISSVKVHASDSSLVWEQTENGLLIKLPTEPPGKHAFVLRVVGQNLTR
jgi:alpha-L-fucosidase